MLQDSGVCRTGRWTLWWGLLALWTAIICSCQFTGPGWIGQPTCAVRSWAELRIVLDLLDMDTRAIIEVVDRVNWTTAAPERFMTFANCSKNCVCHSGWTCTSVENLVQISMELKTQERQKHLRLKSHPQPGNCVIERLEGRLVQNNRRVLFWMELERIFQGKIALFSNLTPTRELSDRKSTWVQFVAFNSEWNSRGSFKANISFCSNFTLNQRIELSTRRSKKYISTNRVQIAPPTRDFSDQKSTSV